MRRFRLRLSTLGLLIAIIALAVALAIEQRRERVLTARVQVLEAVNARDQRIMERIEVTRRREVDELRSKLARFTGEGKDACPSEPGGDGESVRPK